MWSFWDHGFSFWSENLRHTWMGVIGSLTTSVTALANASAECTQTTKREVLLNETFCGLELVFWGVTSPPHPYFGLVVWQVLQQLSGASEPAAGPELRGGRHGAREHEGRAEDLVARHGGRHPGAGCPHTQPSEPR